MFVFLFSQAVFTLLQSTQPCCPLGCVPYYVNARSDMHQFLH